VDIEREDYFLEFFLLGAYQETIGMKHNLFSKPTEATIKIDDNSYTISNINNSPTIIEILDDLEYDVTKIKDILRIKLTDSKSIQDSKKIYEIKKLEKLMGENGYLKTID
jgi:arginine decarboxylase